MAKIAIIETGGKQYLVTQDSVLNVDPIRKPSASNGAGKLAFDKVLLVDDGKTTTVGTPYIAGAVVSAEHVADGREKKVTVIRYRQKSRYFKKRGHRQPFMKVRITALP
ncbi:MAG: 50S ribosomal protein L21 [Patescibacteria group bacterium]